MDKQTVYIKVDVKYELPNDTGWYSCNYFSDLKDFLWFDLTKKEFLNNYGNPIEVNYWLKEQPDSFVFTIEELKQFVRKLYIDFSKTETVDTNTTIDYVYNIEDYIKDKLKL